MSKLTLDTKSELERDVEHSPLSFMICWFLRVCLTLQEHQKAGFDRFSDDQMIPILLNMRPDALLNIGRSL